MLSLLELRWLCFKQASKILGWPSDSNSIVPARGFPPLTTTCSLPSYIPSKLPQTLPSPALPPHSGLLYQLSHANQTSYAVPSCP
jgi:hypothetical protein